MKITRIPRIKGHGIFRDFAWSNDLQPFGRFNLIYGWNGTGKTTLAGLLRSLQDRTATSTGEVVFEIDDSKVSGSDLAEAVLPPVRVFNRDSIAATVSSSDGNIAPIYFFGQDSVEKQRQVEHLKKALELADRQAGTAKAAKETADKALSALFTGRAKFISDLLAGSRTLGYKNYDKRNFQRAVENLTPGTRNAALLNHEEKAALRSRKDGQPKPTLPRIACEVPDFAELASSAESLLKRSVVSTVIADLVGDPKVGTWVQQGLALHTGERSSDECRFCAQKLAPERVAALEAHFNDEFSRLQTEVDSLVTTVDSHRSRLANVALPEPSRLYEHLASDLEAATASVRKLSVPADAYLESLRTQLLVKKESPFVLASIDLPVAPDRNAILQAIATVNGVVEKHNSTTSRFQNEVEVACKKLEDCYVAEAFEDFSRLGSEVTAAESSLTTANTKAQCLRHEIVTIEREIKEHRRPAEELNAELHAYLGRDELRFEVKESGYAMTRDGQPASGLSEGEKTAVAFLYFLKSLQDKSFDLANGVVVIDDPVSSLDANALFSAFGYMKERTKNAGQLFVLTHNFCFFRQVNNWYRHLPLQKKKDPALHPARLYLLQAASRDGRREAALSPIDKLLQDYESEYHYIFKRVYEGARQGTGGEGLEACYGVPNMARRLVEAFLSFRFPGFKAGDDLTKQLDAVPFDAAKKTRIIRFLHTHSHHARVAEPEHDPSVLSETGAILGDVLSFIEATDRDHFNGMMTLVTGPADPEAT